MVFEKEYGTQSCSLLMLEFFKNATQKNKAFGALLTDLSKEWDCLDHDLLIAKLHAYSLNISSSNLLQDYLSKRKQRPKLGFFFNSWEDVLSGVPQNPILGLLLFNTFMCDMFLILKTEYFTGYTDANTPFVVAYNIEDVIQSFEKVGENLIT